MKNVFGYKFEKGTDELPGDGAHFVAQEASEQLKSDIERFAMEGETVLEKAQLPGWLGLVKTAALLGFAVVLLTAFKNLGELSISEMYGNAPVVFIVGAVCLAVWFVLFLYERAKLKKVDETGAFERIGSRAAELKARAENELGIPHNAPEVDIMTFIYTEKDGERKVKKQMLYSYENVQMNLFRDGDKICLASMTELYEFPAEGFRKYILKKKSADLSSWNKDEAYNKGRYKEYKIKVNDYDVVTCKYCSVVFNDSFEDYEIFFPAYELDTFKRIIELPVDLE